MNEAQRKTLAALDAREWRTAAELATALKSRPGPVTRTLSVLIARGHAAERGVTESHYRRTAAGTKALSK